MTSFAIVGGILALVGSRTSSGATQPGKGVPVASVDSSASGIGIATKVPGRGVLELWYWPDVDRVSVHDRSVDGAYPDAMWRESGALGEALRAVQKAADRDCPRSEPNPEPSEDVFLLRGTCRNGQSYVRAIGENPGSTEDRAIARAAGDTVDQVVSKLKAMDQ